MNKKHGYIISGAGCSGLSLLYYILQSSTLQQKKILIIDQNSKTENDKTWCFWENQAGSFENLVYSKWSQLALYNKLKRSDYQINPFIYKMIRGIDFYEFVKKEALKFSNVEFIETEVLEINSDEAVATVITNKGSYTAAFCFNSILFNKEILNTTNSLLQHFKGIVIKTKEEVFDTSKALFMDFRVDQKKDTKFFYVLPTSPSTALVEFTIFSKSLLKEPDYDDAIKNYIKNQLQINSYTELHKEFGIIPMTDYIFPTHHKRIINMGTAAGWVKASSGFAFSNIQKQTKKIVSLLTKDKPPILNRKFKDVKFHFYDSILLDVLAKEKMQGAEIFTQIFEKINQKKY